MNTHASPAPMPSAPSGTLLIGGGLLMLTMYGLEIVYGMRYGTMPGPEALHSSPLLFAQAICFGLGLLLIGAGLAEIGRALRSHAPILATLGIALAVIAIACCTINLTLISGALGQITPLGELGGLAVVANLAASTLLGVAALRTRAIARSIAITLLTVGLITFPCILLTIPLEALLPAYIVADLPFPIWGAVCAGLGGLLLQSRARPALRA